MSCRNIDEKLYELRRCGCRRCEDEYDYLMRIERERERRHYSTPPMLQMLPPGLGGDFTLSAVILKEPKMEEPKNIAIKVLVEKLKTEQSTLASTETSLKLCETYVKTHRDNKSKNQRAIKELAAALKKLGHKDQDSK